MSKTYYILTVSTSNKGLHPFYGKAVDRADLLVKPILRKSDLRRHFN
jgi:hypothetical protein